MLNNQQQFNQLVSFIWNIANDVLVQVFNKGDYKKVILPMMVLRRLDILLEPSKEAVLKQKEQLDKIKEVVADPAYADKYDEHDAKSDTTITYVQTGLKVAKLYAPFLYEVLIVCPYLLNIAKHLLLRKSFCSSSNARTFSISAAGFNSTPK